MQSVSSAISRSASHNEIVHLESMDPVRVVAACDELQLLCDDSVEVDGDLTEYWGTDDAGNEWRVHVRLVRDA